MPRATQIDPAPHRTDLAAILFLCLCASVWIGIQLPRPRITFADNPPSDSQRVQIAHERIDPNTASAASMLRLRGIGPARAKAIIEYRITHGPNAFKTAEDLTKIRGIGPGIVHGIASELSLPRGDTGR